MLPLVSCIMPTTSARRAFLPQAIRHFLAQDYPRKQLVVLDNGERPVDDLIPSAIETEDSFFQPITYSRHVGPKVTVGELRNMACERADGDYIAHFDDDDWHAPDRLSKQVEVLVNSGADLTGSDRLVFFDEDNNRAWLYRSVKRTWLAGGTLVYSKALWKTITFRAMSNGEDTMFVDDAYRMGAKVTPTSDESLYVARIHPGNTARKKPDCQWGGFPVETVRRWTGENISGKEKAA